MLHTKKYIKWSLFSFRVELREIESYLSMSFTFGAMSMVAFIIRGTRGGLWGKRGALWPAVERGGSGEAQEPGTRPDVWVCGCASRWKPCTGVCSAPLPSFGAGILGEMGTHGALPGTPVVQLLRAGPHGRGALGAGLRPPLPSSCSQRPWAGPGLR